MPHLTSQEKTFLICLCCVIATGSAINSLYKSRQDFVKTIELSDVRPFIRQVNINTASPEELMRVPYIGEKTAQRILDYRKEHGAFTDLQQIKMIRGIYPNSFEKMKHYLKI